MDRNGYGNDRSREEIIQMYSVPNPGYDGNTSSPHDGPNFAIEMDAAHQFTLDDRDMRYDRDPHRHHWASDSMRSDDLIHQLPSRQLEYVASNAAGTIGRRKTLHKNYHGSIRLNKQELNDLTNSLNRNTELMDEVDGEEKTIDVLRESGLKLTDKKLIKSELSEKRRQKTMQRGAKRPGWWKRTKYSMGISWVHFKYNIASIAYSMELWRSLMRKIEGHFGTGVSSYFLFLKWIFLLNIPIFIMTFGFVVIPQILYDQHSGNEKGNNASFSGAELLTGGGYFNETILYYGHYTNGSVQLVGSSVYDMKYAYLFTGGGYYILCLLILALSISKSYKKNYIEASGTFNFYIVTKVFCGWDYNITADDAAKLRHKSFRNEMKEYLSGKKDEEEVATCGTKTKWFLFRLFTNLNVIGIIGGSSYAIYVIQNNDTINNSVFILGELAMPLVATGIIFILPFIFTIIGHFEQYEKPQTELYIGMLRTMVLKACVLGILVYFWFSRTKTEDVCWERILGQEIYRLVLVDFVFILLGTLFIEFFKGLMAKYCCQIIGEPEFDIGRNTLDLIYSQVLCWLGSFYSPLLSLIVSIKLFIIFYVKAISVLQNCKPSLRPWRASKTHTVFMGFLFAFFILSVAAVGYGVLMVKPSPGCGPFQGLDNTYEAVTELVYSWKEHVEGLHVFVDIITSPGAIAIVLVVVSVLTYYVRILMIGHKEMVELMRQQLNMEGRDKAYLLKMLQNASDRKKNLSPNKDRLMSPTQTSHVTPSAGGRTFAKAVAKHVAERSPAPSAAPRHRYQ